MKDSRYKKIMKDLGMPNSKSLFVALQKVANETAQEVHSEYRKNNKKLQMDRLICDTPDKCNDFKTKKCNKNCGFYPPTAELYY